MDHLEQRAAVARFAELHSAGCFVLPNPFDVGSAIVLEQLGFAAVATSSAGLAFSRGLPDSVTALSCDAVLAHVREIAAAVTVPVSVDFQDGYAADAAGVAANVARCIEAGCSGLSIEDASGDPAAPLYDRERAIERVRAARRQIDASGVPVVLTARCEAWLVGDPRPATTAIDRLVAFADAGADCLYAPGVRDLETICQIVDAVAPRPVNALMSAPGLTAAQLAGVGVRRISVGSALARVAWRAFIEAARSIAETGSFDALAGAPSTAELSARFAGRDPGAR